MRKTIRKRGDGTRAATLAVSLRGVPDGRIQVLAYVLCHGRRRPWLACGQRIHLPGSGAGKCGPFPTPPASFGSLVATYSYEDEYRRLLYQVCRYYPKEFRIRRPDSAGGWRYHLKGVPRVLYRLPRVLIAVAVQHEIFLVEGEKAVNALELCGFTATCSPSGAGQWRDVYAEDLRGANVIILPDNDAVGHRHAEQVAASLHRVAGCVRVLHLPGLHKHGDICDWLGPDNGPEELVALTDDTPEWEPKEAS